MAEVVNKATEKVRQLAQKASDIQDACNSRAVARFLIEVQDYFSEPGQGQQYCGSAMAAQNPVSVAVLNKLNHLAGLEQSRERCFDAVMDLAEGKDVDWEIDFS